MKISSVIQASVLPVLEVALVCLSGALLVYKGLLDVDGRKAINVATYYLFMPALMFFALVRSVTIVKLLSWWSLLVNMALSVVLGMVAGWITAPLVGTPRHLKPHFVCCASMGNVGNLLLVMVPAIARASSIFNAGDATRGLEYVFVGVTVIFIGVFSIADDMLTLRPLPLEPTASPPPAAVHVEMTSPTTALPSPPAGDLSIQPTPTDDEGSASAGCHPPPRRSESCADEALTRLGADKVDCGVGDEQGARLPGAPIRTGTPLSSNAPPASSKEWRKGAPVSGSSVPDRMPESALGHSAAVTSPHRTGCGHTSVEEAPQQPCATPPGEDTLQPFLPMPLAGAQAPEGIRTAAQGPRARMPPDASSANGDLVDAGPTDAVCCRGTPNGDSVYEGAMETHGKGGASSWPCLSACCIHIVHRDAPFGSRAQADGTDGRRLAGARNGLQLRRGRGKSTNGCCDTDEVDSALDPTSLVARQATAPRESAFARRKREWLERARQLRWFQTGERVVMSLYNVPTLSMFGSIFVASIPALQALFFAKASDSGSDSATAHSDRPPLDVITQATDLLGGAMLPCVLVCLGGSLIQGPGAGKVSWRVVAALAVLRLLILPAVGAAIVLGTKAAGWWSPPDKMYTMVLLLQHAMPAAMNLHVVASMRHNHDEEMATIIFWQHIASIVTLPICIGAFLQLLA